MITDNQHDLQEFVIAGGTTCENLMQIERELVMYCLDKESGTGTATARVIRVKNVQNVLVNNPVYAASVLRMLLRIGMGTTDNQVAGAIDNVIASGAAACTARFGAHVLAPPTLADAKMLADAIEKTLLGKHRTVFPVYVTDNGEGDLIWAEITAHDAETFKQATSQFEWFPKDKDDRLLVAPWTFFEPIDESDIDRSHGLRSFSSLRSDISSALRAVGNDQRYKDLLFILDLKPLRDSNFVDGAGAAAAPALSTGIDGLLPGRPQVRGPSLGVSVAIAAYAASNALSVGPVVASGGIDAKGNVLRVDGLEVINGAVGQKWKAIESLFELLKATPWHIVIPNETQIPNSLLDDGQNIHIHKVRNISELFKVGILVDGFDDYRSHLGVSTSAQGTGWKSPFEKLAEAIDWNVDASVPPLPSFAVIAKRLAGEVVDKLECGGKRAGSECFWIMAGPFDEGPAKLAFFLAEQLRKNWWAQNKGTLKFVDLPVVLPICLRDFFASQTGDARTLDVTGFQRSFAETAAASLVDMLGKGPVSQHTLENAMLNALRKPNKLVFVVYDEPSSVLWTRISNETRYQEYPATLGILRQLGIWRAPVGFGWRGQYVIAVASDFHHQQLWLGEEASSAQAPQMAHTSSG